MPLTSLDPERVRAAAPMAAATTAAVVTCTLLTVLALAPTPSEGAVAPLAPVALAPTPTPAPTEIPARASAPQPIGSVGVARIALSTGPVRVATSVEAWPSLSRIETTLARDTRDAATVRGTGRLTRPAAGGTTWRGVTELPTSQVALGRYTLIVSAYASGAEPVAIVRVPVLARSPSSSTLTAIRAAGSVRLSARVSYVHAGHRRVEPLAGARVSFQARAADGTWTQVAVATADRSGTAAAGAAAATPRAWRAVVGGTDLIWDSTSPVVTR